MAKNYKRKPVSKKANRSFHAKEMRDFAYKMGLVQRGLNAGDTQVAASFNSGLEKKARKPKKPLY